MQALKNQFPVEQQYNISQYALFKFELESAEPIVRIIVEEQNQFTIGMEPQAAQVFANSYCKYKTVQAHYYNHYTVYTPAFLI